MQAMGAMQAMNQQSELAECSSEITAQGVRVNVTSALVEVCSGHRSVPQLCAIMLTPA